MKRAFIVYFSVATRVEVDVPKDKVDNSPMRDDELFAIVADEAAQKITANASSYLVRENVDDIVEEYE